MKIKVEDMSCKHCVAKIEKSLLLHGVDAQVTLSDHTVTVKKDSDQEKAFDAITKAGYTPSL